MESASKNHLTNNRPLVVDMDGTLIHTDMLQESFIKIMRDNPSHLVFLSFWILKGRAVLKRNLAKITSFDPKILPYHQELIEWLTIQKSQGRTLILCTASEMSVANEIAEYLDIFDQVMASDGKVNLSGQNKAKRLEEQFGNKNFDYVGNSISDLKVWEKAHEGVVVNASDELVKSAQKVCKVKQVFPKSQFELKTWRKVFRVHQWLKNLLLFIPMFAAHQVTNINDWVHLLLAFISFSLCTSSVYTINDLLDLDNDRHHPNKKNRPFASGRIPIWQGVVLAPLLLIISFILARFVGGYFGGWLLLYFSLACAYSWGIKRLVLMDCLVLSFFYTLRILAGAAVVHVILSFWLLAFSIFFFMSLAFLKRYAELKLDQISGIENVAGRGYYASDAPLVQIFGVTASYVSVLLLALYINSDEIVKLYNTPVLIWGAVPLMLMWVSWVWMKAHRGEMVDDPIVFAIRDRTSIFILFLFVILFLLAMFWQ